MMGEAVTAMDCDISFTLRAATADDEGFVRDLYLGWLSDRLGLDQFPAPLRESLLETQWRGHRLGLRGTRPDAVSSVVEVAGGPVGWTLVDRTGAGVHLVEIHVAPSWRGRGLGRALIAALQREAAEAGRCVTLSVHHDNPGAQALYHRMGFVVDPAVAEPAPQGSPVLSPVLPLRWTPS